MFGKIIKYIVIPLLIGMAIYVCFRGNDLVVYSWFPILKGISNVFYIQDGLSFIPKSVREFVIYSLPDGLWLYSFTCFMIIIWDKSQSKLKYVWMSFAVMIALTHEIGQGLGLVVGTFDLKDLTVYVFAALAAVIVTKKFFRED